MRGKTQSIVFIVLIAVLAGGGYFLHTMQMDGLRKRLNDRCKKAEIALNKLKDANEEARANEAEARARLTEAIDSGAALQKLADMVKAQGGDPSAVFDVSLLPAAPVQRSVKAPVSGYITAMEARDIGLVSMHLGGGRATKEDVIDLSVGVVLRAKVGAHLSAGDELAVIHAASEADAEAAEKELLACFTFADAPVERPPFIRGVVC